MGRVLHVRQITKRLSKASSIDELMRLHEAHGWAFNDVHLGTCWGRLGRLAQTAAGARWIGYESEQLSALRDRTLFMLQRASLSSRSLASTAHGLALSRLSHRRPWGAVWQAVQDNAVELAPRFNLIDSANVAWAFATAADPAPDLFDALSAAVVKQADQLRPRELASLAWAFATAKHRAPELFVTLSYNAQGRLSEFNQQDIANTAWAFATLQQADPPLFEALGAEACGRACEFTPQALANTAWAFAALQHPAPELFRALCSAALPNLRSYKPTELSMLVPGAMFETGRSRSALPCP